MASRVEARDVNVVPVLQSLLGKGGELRGDAIRALASFDDAKTPKLLVEAYPSLPGDEKRAAIRFIRKCSYR